MTLRVVDLGIANYDQDMGDSQVGLAFYVAAAATAGLNLSASALGAVLAAANVYLANEAVLPSAYQRCWSFILIPMLAKALPFILCLPIYVPTMTSYTLCLWMS